MSTCENNTSSLTAPDARVELQALVETIWRLRQPDGCPWDREQTHASIAKNLIEEAYEAVACIEENDSNHLREELGDVLMQVVLHAQIAADEGTFTLADVAGDINEKLIRRHPHVFGEARAHTPQEVAELWDQVKIKEKQDQDAELTEAGIIPQGLLDGVPRALPALAEAQKVSKKAASVGFDWPTVDAVWDKVEEERAEFHAEELGSNERTMEFGDMLFALVNVARKEGIDAEFALRASTAKFRQRWTEVERLAQSRGAAPHDLTPMELEELWNLAKQTTRGE